VDGGGGWRRRQQLPAIRARYRGRVIVASRRPLRPNIEQPLGLVPRLCSSLPGAHHVLIRIGSLEILLLHGDKKDPAQSLINRRHYCRARQRILRLNPKDHHTSPDSRGRCQARKPPKCRPAIPDPPPAHLDAIMARDATKTPAESGEPVLPVHQLLQPPTRHSQLGPPP
jgi:hypothetical protein